MPILFSKDEIKYFNQSCAIVRLFLCSLDPLKSAQVIFNFTAPQPFHSMNLGKSKWECTSLQYRGGMLTLGPVSQKK